MNNGLTGLVSRYESPVAAMKSGVDTVIFFRHGRSRAPFHALWTAVCLQADQAYQPGDELDAAGLQKGGYSIVTGRNACQVWAFLRQDKPPGVPAKNAQAGALSWNGINLSNWGLKCRASW